MYKLEDDDTLWIQNDGDVFLYDLAIIAKHAWGDGIDVNSKLKVRIDYDEAGNGYFVLSME